MAPLNPPDEQAALTSNYSNPNFLGTQQRDAPATELLDSTSDTTTAHSGTPLRFAQARGASLLNEILKDHTPLSPRRQQAAQARSAHLGAVARARLADAGNGSDDDNETHVSLLAAPSAADEGKQQTLKLSPKECSIRSITRSLSQITC